ncbi:transposase [Halobacterium sp. CBA1132]|uniref:transposase n=2 Tax=Halobacterium TaxID=2239 RepID=UPI00073EC065
MAASSEPASDRSRRMTNSFRVGIQMSRMLYSEEPVSTIIGDVPITTNTLEDSYPEWHPAPYPFEAMLRLFLYRELTGNSYDDISESSELAAEIGLDSMPDPSVLSRTWRDRFDEAVREFVETAAHYAVKENHDRGYDDPEIRPKEDIIQEEESEQNETDDEKHEEFTDEQIFRTTRLAREHGFGAFDSGRAQNSSYDDTQFFELQTYMGMVGCGTAQGAARFQLQRGVEYGPHGDTHLRTVKQFDRDALIEGFDRATERLLSQIESEATFRRPVTVAIDITTIPYHGDVEGMPMVSGTKEKHERAFKFATLSIVGRNVPIILAIEPVRESSSWDENPSNKVHRVVRRLIQRAQEHVPIEMVLCDREFDSIQTFQTLSNLGVEYLIPKRISNQERDAIDQMEEDGVNVAVQPGTMHTDSGSHSMRFLYVPSNSGDGTAVFATNRVVKPAETEIFCDRYRQRWQIENEYKSIKNDFLAKTSSRDYRVRLFYFVFAALLYNIWRITDVLLKAGVDGEMEYAPEIPAGMVVEMVSAALVPVD